MNRKYHYSSDEAMKPYERERDRDREKRKKRWEMEDGARGTGEILKRAIP